MRTKGYDPACGMLAIHFLPRGASMRLVNELAQAIQDAVEQYLESETAAIVQQLEANDAASTKSTSR